MTEALTINIPEIVEALRLHSLVLFVGADLPRAITGLPSRADLARELAHRKELDESLSLAEVAQRVGRSGNRWEFTAFIRDALDTTGRSPQPFHRHIVEMVRTYGIKTIITTAYDNLLELAFQDAGVGINCIVRGSDVNFINLDRPTLIKLYGDAQQPDTLVVTDGDHSELLRHREREALVDEVRRALRLNTAFFIGYGLADPDFRFLFDQIAESRFSRTAYAVWPGLPEVDLQMWRDRGIVILEANPLRMLGGLVAQSMPDLGSEAMATTRKKTTISKPYDSPPIIVVDVRHGARIGHSFEEELTRYGYVVRYLSTPLIAHSLSRASILTLFVSLPDHTGQPLLPEELASIHSYVTYGGSLFLIGLGWVWKQYGQKQDLTMDDYPLNQITYPHYGTYFQGEPLDKPHSTWDNIDGYPCARFSTANMAQHPICEGLQTIASFGMSSTLEVEPPATPLVWDGNDTDRCILAAWEGQSRGRVVCLQHEGYFKDDDVNKNGIRNILEYDNRRLLLNIAQWLSGRDWSTQEHSPELASDAQDAPASQPTHHNTQAIRDLLITALNDEDLTTLCFDHFRPVYEDLSTGMSTGQKIQRLLDYCARHGYLEELVEHVQERNPVQYAHFRDQLRRC